MKAYYSTIWAVISIAAILPTEAGEPQLTDIEILSPTQVIVRGAGLSGSPSAITLFSTGDLSAGFQNPATFPLFENLGDGNFTFRGTHGELEETAFFRVSIATGESIYTPDLSSNLPAWDESRNFTNIRVWGKDPSTVFSGEIEFSLYGPESLGTLSLPSVRTLQLSSPLASLQFFGVDDTVVNGPRYIYGRFADQNGFTDDASLEFLQVIIDNDFYYQGSIDTGEMPLTFKLKIARGTNPDRSKFLELAIDGDEDTMFPAGESLLTGTLTASSFSATGTIPAISTLPGGHEIDLGIEFIEAGSIVTDDRITGTARVTHTVVDRSDSANPVTLAHMTTITEGPYQLRKEAAPVTEIDRGLISE